MFEWILKKIKRNNKGFTLVELVVVIAILGILAGIAVPKLGASRKNAAITAHNANVKTLMSAATMYIADTWDGKSEVEWTREGEDKTWESYLQKWPEIPKGLGDTEETETDGEKVTIEITDYTVTISTSGEITVTPMEIKPLEKDGK